AVGGRLDDLAERLNSLTTTERIVADHARSLASLEAGLSSIRLDVAQLAADLQARPVIIAAEPQPQEPTGPIWLALVDDLSSSNSGVRWNAVEDLGHTGDPGVVPHLLPVLDDEDTFVRMAAARVLGELGGDESVGPLIDTLSDPAESVRDAAVASLRQITGQNFRFDPLAKQAERTKRIRAWRDWWEKQGKA
ncbi:MAG: HEAT repeat domain-containing protein, partial [Myxococcales bacterium]|nr:HEAT repeat domain-containing protein [Myxococcales bacterium]